MVVTFAQSTHFTDPDNVGKVFLMNLYKFNLRLLNFNWISKLAVLTVTNSHYFICTIYKYIHKNEMNWCQYVVTIFPIEVAFNSVESFVDF